MNVRLNSLIERGYSPEEVEYLSSFSEEELDYCSNMALIINSEDCQSVDNPIAVYIGGQPGCGKTTISMNIKNNHNNFVEIGIDNYRMYHPKYLEMEETIKKHWQNRKQSINDTPGNDIADFTHEFAGKMTDELIRKASDKNYNLLLEWGMREPTVPLENMMNLKEKNYHIDVLFLAVNKYISMEACNIRASIMSSSDRIVRKIPPYFHDLSIRELPDSANYLYKNGYCENIIDEMKIITRDGKEVWDAKSKQYPGNIYNEYLQNYNLTKNLKNSTVIANFALEKEKEGILLANMNTK